LRVEQLPEVVNLAARREAKKMAQIEQQKATIPHDVLLRRAIEHCAKHDGRDYSGLIELVGEPMTPRQVAQPRLMGKLRQWGRSSR